MLPPTAQAHRQPSGHRYVFGFVTDDEQESRIT